MGYLFIFPVVLDTCVKCAYYILTLTIINYIWLFANELQRGTSPVFAALPLRSSAKGGLAMSNSKAAAPSSGQY